MSCRFDNIILIDSAWKNHCMFIDDRRLALARPRLEGQQTPFAKSFDERADEPGGCRKTNRYAAPTGGQAGTQARYGSAARWAGRWDDFPAFQKVATSRLDHHNLVEAGTALKATLSRLLAAENTISKLLIAIADWTPRTTGGTLH